MSSTNIEINSEAIVERLELFNNETLNFYDLWLQYNFPIIFSAIFILLTLLFLFLYNQKKNVIFKLFVIICTIPLSFLCTQLITDRKPQNFSEFIYYNPNYSVVFSDIIKLNNKDIYLLPKGTFIEKYSFSINPDIAIKIEPNIVKEIYFNASVLNDHMSNQKLLICSVFFFVEPGYGDLSNNQYISVGFKTSSPEECVDISQKISKFVINKEAKKTEASIIKYTYPTDINEFNVGIVTDEDKEPHEHNHEDDHSYTDD